jgi:hypothetical protein
MDFADFQKELVSPALRAVAAHWDEARGSSPVPSWEQLSPKSIAPYLTILWPYKYDQTSGQFVGRLAGNGIAWCFEKNFRGLPLQETWSPEVADQSHDRMIRVISEPLIYRSAGPLFKQGGRTIEGERMALPLVSGVLGASAYQIPSRNLAQGAIELLFENEKMVLRNAGSCARHELTTER